MFVYNFVVCLSLLKYIFKIPAISLKVNKMRPFIIIRKFEKRDDIPVQKVIQKYHKKLANVVFISCLFKEITLQICVLSWAILFIFMGIPLSVCFLSIPGTLVFILFAVYTTYYNKSVEMAMVL